MKINGIPPSNVINQYIHVRENLPTSNKVNQPADKVELTKESQTFSAALKEAKKAVETRTPAELKRIEDVSKLVREGNYNVSGEDVAAKILGLEE
jgi:anti-sigma28 factor (negative regulator of flagellin synthesis)